MPTKLIHFQLSKFFLHSINGLACAISSSWFKPPMSVNIQPLLQEPLGLLSTVCKQRNNLKAWSKLAACDCLLKRKVVLGHPVTIAASGLDKSFWRPTNNNVLTHAWTLKLWNTLFKMSLSLWKKSLHENVSRCFLRSIWKYKVPAAKMDTC